MELDSLTVMNVAIVDGKEKTVKVSLRVEDDEVKAEELHKKICTQLGLKQSSWRYFIILQGIENPTRVYKNTDKIPITARELSFQKWCFQKSAVERLSQEDVALELLFQQAKFDIATGKLLPNSEQLQQLDEYLDPGFPLKNRYVSLCQDLAHSTSVLFRTCSLIQDFHTHAVQISANQTFTLLVGRSGLRLHIDRKIYAVPWSHIKSWRRSEQNDSVSYQVYCGTDMLPWLLIASTQAAYLLAATMEMIRVLQSESEEGLFFNTSMVKNKDAVMMVWDNALYNPDSDFNFSSHQDTADVQSLTNS